MMLNTCTCIIYFYLKLQPFATCAVYCGTKYFVEGLTASMRKEVVKYGIKMTSIQPGDVDTELWKLTTDEEVIGNLQWM